MKELLKDINDNNILLDIVDGELKVFASESYLNPALISKIKARKKELVQFLLANGQPGLEDASQMNIPLAPGASNYPLSSAQRRLWVLSQFEEGNVAYNISGVYVFEGELDMRAFSYSFKMLIDRHEILRTVFKEDEQGDIKQFILSPENTSFKIGSHDLRQENDQEEKLKKAVQEETGRPFNLAAGSLLRAGLYQVTDNKWIFTYTMHHIISDAWSMDILIKELLLFYNAYINGEGCSLAPLRIQYKDYAAWQQDQLNGQALQDHKAYWLKQFEGELPVLQLPGDKTRPAVKTYNGGTVSKCLKADISKSLKTLNQQEGSTLFMSLLAAVNALLYRYSGQHDIIIGTSIASREHADLENQIGFYVNTLALRTQFSGRDNYRELLNNIKQVTLGAYEHQVYPFDELVNALSLQRDMSRSSLFDVMVVLQNTSPGHAKEPQSLGNIKVSGYEAGEDAVSKFDLTFFFPEADEELQLNIVYNKDIYHKATVERLADHLAQLLEAIIANPSQSIDPLDYLSAEEKHQLSVTFAESESAYPPGKTVVDLFEEQAARTPGNTALSFEGQSLTYKKLDEQTTNLAQYLRTNYDIKAGDLVGIMLDRSANMIIALLGILKSGGAYIAIEPDTPRARKEFIINDTGIKALITQTDFIFDLDYYQGNVFAIDIQLDSLETATASPQITVSPADLAYVIYTSGSTGQPKGVMINHRSLVDYSFGILARTNMGSCRSFGLVSTIAADLGNTVIYTSLLVGGKLHVFSTTDVMNGERMLQADLDCIKIVPSHWKALQDGNKLFVPNKCLVFGGEQLTTDVIDLIRLSKSNCEVYNHYGPSETTIGKLVNRIDVADRSAINIPLGSPFCNSSIYILDERNNLLPVGTVGEICIGGHGVAMGYLNQPVLTKQKFVENPFRPGEKMYKTGDLGRWLPNGKIMFLGRKDDQIKIRGYRIELGEIENALKNHADIENATVLSRTNVGGDKELVAYVVSKEPLNKPDIQNWLSKTLPAYMFPSQYVALEALPLTPNGKIDRKRLPDPGDFGLPSGEAYIAPRNETEKKLALIWQEVLGKEKIGIKDNFFGLGGHSLSATRLASQIHKTFEVKVDFHELFSRTVLEEQARLIDQAQKTSFNAIAPAPVQPNYPLSSSQHRLWVLSQFEGGNIAYNVPGVYVFEGTLDDVAFAQSFDLLIARHEILRTVFKEDNQGEIKQFIKTPEEAAFKIGYQDLREECDQQEKIINLVKEEVNKPFDLSHASLIRSNLYRTAHNKWIFTFSMHHIISDAWSKNILLRELLLFYNMYTTGEANPLTPLRIQYKDYACWQQTQLSEDILKDDKSYWLKQFEGELPVLELPADKVRPAVKSFNGGSVCRTISTNITSGMKSLLQEQECTLFMGLLAAVNVLLNRYTNQEDIIIGSQIAGREHADLEDQIGNYLNTLALRTRFNGEYSYKELLENIKQVSLGAYEHQGFPFDELVNALQLRYDMSRNPLFDVSVVLQNTQMNDQAELPAFGDIKVTSYEEVENTISKFDLAFDFIEINDEIQASLIYNSDIYHESTAERFLNHLGQLLEIIVSHPHKAINELDFLSEEEKHQQITEFNNTSVSYPADKTIAALFEEQAAKTPDKVAVICGEKELTYKQLDERSNQLAGYLITNYNVQASDLVAIMLDRSENVIIAILGILKAGAAYVPIDPGYPVARKEFIVNDTGTKILITQTDYIFDLEYYKGAVFAIDAQLDTLNIPGNFPGTTSNPGDLAYVMYTSGSTGMPKGVLVENRSVVRLVKSANYVSLSEEDVLLSTGAISFDATTFEYWSMLLNGGKLVMCSQEVLVDAQKLAEEIGSKSVNIMWFTSGWLNQLADTNIGVFKGLNTIIAGGDKLSPKHINAILREYPGITIINGYGPTENTTFSLTYKLYREAIYIPIGKPISNSTAYIINKKGLLQPIGATGEICVAGDGLARGYLNNDLLTSEKFVANPFRHGERMYKTGDLGRWLPDGNIDFTGRKDEQVKIRGYRIELGEIESALQSYAGVDSAVVLARSNGGGEKSLVAYVVSELVLNAADLRYHVSESLPAYMIPSYFVQLDALPLTQNGKVDRGNLPEPEGLEMPAGVAYVSPNNETEEELALIWQEVLGRERIGTKDNFFELGGDSIKILRMVSEVRKRLHVDIPIADVYKNNTIGSIVANISQDKNAGQKSSHLLEMEAIVKGEIDALKERILASYDIPGRENIEDVYPMSDIEKGMVYESLINEGSGIYHDQLLNQKVFIDFDIDRFKLALELLVEKHPILRTSFHISDYESEVQIVHKKISLSVPCEDISALTRQEQREEVQNFALADFRRPFDFSTAPLWRTNIFKLSKDEIVFVLQMHHSILDGWSHASFITELNNLYLKLEEDLTYKPSKLKASYKEAIIQYLVDKKHQSSFTFWKQELAEFKRLELFTEEHQHQNYSHTADTSYLKKLKKTAGQLNTTVKILSLSAYLYMLKVLNYESEIVAGVVTNTRPGCEDGDKMLGCFLNTIPLKIFIDENATCYDFVKQVHSKLIALKDHERVSLLEIARIHHGEQSASGNPFFDTFFNYVDFHAYESLEADNDIHSNETSGSAMEDISRTYTNLPLEVSINLTGDIYSARFSLSRKLKTGYSAGMLGKLYFKILQYIVQSPNQAIQQSNNLNSAERDQLLIDFNNTHADFPADKTIIDLFEEQVAKAAENIALVFGENEFTFQELNEAANQLASYLRSYYQIQPDDLVGIKLSRSEWMIISILGVLKSGGAYVPIDPAYPQERINYIISDSKCKVLIDEQLLAGFIKEKDQHKKENLPKINNPTDLIYVIYTSGSTGKPKGCMLEHRGVVNRLEWMYQHYSFSGKDVILQKTTFTFDVSVWEIFMPLCWGMKMVLCHNDDIASPVRILSLIKNKQVTCLHFVPSMLNAFIAALFDIENAPGSLNGLRLVITSGEALPAKVVNRWYDKLKIPIHNLYGPTEASVDVTYYATSELDAKIPIGRPIWNTQIYIVGKQDELVPLGISGEICIGGSGLARGYLNQPALTAQKFVENPFRQGERMYRTGDLGRWLPDGNIAYLGRIDDQVKIRGYRIELGEIESVLLQSGMVSQAAVIVKELNHEHKQLVAFIVAGKEFRHDRLVKYLNTQLPDYMNPSNVIELAEIPLTSNGKADRKQLSRLNCDILSAEEYAAPRNKTEEAIVAIWKDILAKERIGIHDNFFRLGGDSIISIRVLSRIKKEFNRELELRRFYQTATVEALAKYLEEEPTENGAKDKLKNDVAKQLEKLKEEIFSALADTETIEDVYPMSDIQKGMVFEQLKNQDNGVYHDQFVYQIPLVDLAVFQKAFSLLVEKHTILRTAFDIYNFIGKDLQIVSRTVSVNIYFEQLLSINPANQEAYIKEYLVEERKKPFAPDMAPLWRISIFQTAPDRMVYVFQFHHAILDGWSVASLNTELYNLCLILKEDPGYIPRGLMSDNKTGIIASLVEKAHEENAAFWKNELIDYRRLPLFNNDDALSTYDKTYPADYLDKLASIANETGVQLKTMFFGAYLYALSMLTNETDITVGLVSNTRPVCEDGDKILGCFLNSIPFRYQTSTDPLTWRDYIDVLDSKLQSLKGRDQLSLYEINRLAGGDLRESNPFFDVIFNYINFHIYDKLNMVQEDAGPQTNLELKSFESTNTYLDVTVSVTGGVLRIIYNQKKALRSGISLEEFNKYFERSLDCIAFKPSALTGNREILAEETIHLLSGDSHSTAFNCAENITIVDLFEEQVNKTPGNIALVFNGEELTYQQLNEKANQLGNYLRIHYNIQADELICINLERSDWMVIAILGILKSGGAYVPIDPEYPQERIEYMVADSACKLLIDEKEIKNFLAEIENYDPCNLKSFRKPKDLAYVIYTSGSTGLPKGVMVECATLNNLCFWHNSNFSVTADDRATLYAGVSFDASVWELFPYLIAGARLYIVPKEIRLKTSKLAAYYDKNKITISFLPTQIGEQFLKEDNQSLRYLLIGGDKLNSFVKKNYQVVNNYGPTENTVVTTSFVVNSLHSNIPIGKPISNTRIYILNNRQELILAGVVGEICIAGAGLARGYLNQPGLTAEKFVPNPFNPGERMYKTGDLGRWLPDGTIEFLGRKDDQVKIRGYRIELGEIETALEGHPEIDTAIVLAKTNHDGHKELVAYIVSKEGLTVPGIRSYLNQLLPVYMIPGHYIQLSKLPLTANGKVDKKALSKLEVSEMETGVAYIAPRNDIETNLVAVYEDVLKKQSIGINEDFFALGGDSIKSIQVVSRLNQRGYSLSIQDVMRYPVIENLAERVQIATRSIDQGLVEGVIPLSPIQSFFFGRNLSNSHHYNQSVLLYSRESLSEEALRASLDKIVLHHDALRMVYHKTPKGWVQRNEGKELRCTLDVIEDTDELSFITHCERIQSGINLAEGPLFKAGLFRGIDGDRLLLVAHHLVIDGVSWRILFEDLSALYQQYISGKCLQLPAKTDSFKYWQERQMEYASGKALQKEEAYWSAIESLDMPCLPLDNSEGSNFIKDAGSESFLLDESATKRLLTQCYKAYHTDVNDVLLGACSMAVSEVFGLQKVLINLEGHGRENIGHDVDVTRTVGWFTTQYPVVFDMSYRDDIIRQLIEVKETLHRVPNKGIGYGVLRYLSGKNYRLSPEISFNYLGDFGSGVKTEQGEQLFEFSGDNHGNPVSANEQRSAVLDVSGMMVEGKIRLSVSYSTKQYSKATIEWLLACYQHHLEDIVARLSAEQKEHLTPVDLTYKGLQVEQVQELNADFTIEDIYPLSPLQEGLYYHWLSAPESPAYFEQMHYQLKGNLNLDALKESYRMLALRHAILRTCFTRDFGETTLQIVNKEAKVNFKYIDVFEEPNFSPEGFRKSNRADGFDLYRGSQMRLTILGLGDSTYEFIWSYHHILMDGWCVGILIKEFFQLYNSILQGKTPNLGEVQPYSTYVEWLMNRDSEPSLQYWKNYLSGYDTIRGLPKIATKQKPEYHLQERKFSLGTSVTQSIHSLCAQSGITENTFIQAVWGILLCKYNNTKDVVFGAVVSGRPAEIKGIEEMIGLFINTIPVRIRVSETTTTTQLLKEVQQNAIKGTGHHYTQLAEVQSRSELGGNLFDHILIFENYPLQEMIEEQMSSGELSLLSSATTEQTNYDFAITIAPGETITIQFEHNCHVYDETFINSVQAHFTRLIEKVLENPSKSIHEIDYLSEAENHQLLVTFNDTAVSYAESGTIVNLFEQQVEKTPGNIALVFEENEFTYRELNDRANRLGAYIKHHYNLQPDDLVGIKLERSEWMIIAILGVLKSGAAYVPIDTAYPDKRIEYMIADSNCKVVIDENELERFRKEENKHNTKNPASVIKPSDLAYVIYTSGTTGEPKGVMIEHSSLLDYATTFSTKFNLQESDIVIQQSSFSFDTHVEEIYPVLLRGGSILMGRAGGRDINELKQLIQEKNATVLSATPLVLAELNSINIHLNKLRLLISGGDRFNGSYISNYIGKVAIYDSYGPSESTVCSTYFKIENKHTDSTIGKPINNRCIYILGNDQELQPVGVTGEICIGGKGLARGYLNQPSLTAEKFIINPFKQSERLYKTGDLGRWLPDGNIEFLGRNDEQVKIRGYRIELGEIEGALQSHEQVDSAVVVAKLNVYGEKELVAYTTGSETLNVSDLRSFLGKTLPAYMIPIHFVSLTSLPVTSNGKVDKKNLPNPEDLGMYIGTEYVAPRNETEEKLVMIWREILGKEKISVKDNFFELGGHSLKVTRLTSQIHKTFDVQVALKDVFSNATIELLSDIVKANKWIERSKLVELEEENTIEI